MLSVQNIDLFYGAAQALRSVSLTANIGRVTCLLGRTIRFVEGTAACGFPSPADDYLEHPLDFNELLIRNPAATFAVRLASDSMTGAGLFPGDIAVIDRSVTPTPGCIVLALIDSEFTIKRYRPRDGKIVLQAENPAFPDIEVTSDRAFEVWGVVTKSIRMLSP